MYYCGLKQAVCPKKDTSISYNKCCYSCKEECPQRCKLFDDTDFKKQTCKGLKPKEARVWECVTLGK